MKISRNDSLRASSPAYIAGARTSPQGARGASRCALRARLSIANSTAKTESPTTALSGRGFQLDYRQVPPVLDMADHQRELHAASALNMCQCPPPALSG